MTSSQKNFKLKNPTPQTENRKKTLLCPYKSETHQSILRTHQRTPHTTSSAFSSTKEQNWTSVQNNLTARIHLKRNNPLLSEKELICPQLPPLPPPPPQLLLQHQILYQPNPIPQLSSNELELPLTSHDADMLNPEEEEEVETLALLEEEDKALLEEEDQVLLEEEDRRTHREEEALQEELDHHQSPLHK